MKIANPIQGFIPKSWPDGDVTQWFGENPALYSKVCSPDGACLTGGHNGVDIVHPYGTPILCVSGGKVVEIKEDSAGYGKHVRVLDNDYEWVYGHLSEIQCTLGQILKTGDVLGLMGNTGFVITGPAPTWHGVNPDHRGTHLHLGRRKFTSYSGLGQWNISYATGDKGTIENHNNGFQGSVPIVAEDFAISEIKDITDTIAIDTKEADKQNDPTIKSAFMQAVHNLLQRLISIVK